MIDVGRQIDAVRRQVGTRAGRSGEARVVTVRQTYDVTREEVWDACTNARRIPRWFLPVSGELRLGGTYQLEGNAGGTVERCDPPRGFAATWEFGGEVSWIEVRLTAVAKAVTRFELAHIAHVDEERWAKYGPGAVGVGWDLGLMGLAVHLSSGRSEAPKESVAWLASEDGRRFVTRSSEGWYRASLAAGEPESAARGPRPARPRRTAGVAGTERPRPEILRRRPDGGASGRGPGAGRVVGGGPRPVGVRGYPSPGGLPLPSAAESVRCPGGVEREGRCPQAVDIRLPRAWDVTGVT